jgi:hypothetical protein
MVASFNLTKATMDCLREEKLNTIIAGTNTLYEGVRVFMMMLN